MALPTVNLVAVGDSEFSAHDGTSLPAQLANRLAGVGTITLTNLGQAGQTLEQQLTGYASTIAPTYNASSNRNICVLHHGSNDLLANITMAAWQVKAQTLVTNMVTTGFEVVSSEAYQWLFDAFPGSLFNTASDWAAYNAAVNVSGISALINISKLTALCTQANVNQPPYYIDTMHLSAAGANLWADFAAPIVTRLITGPVVSSARRVGFRLR